MRASQLGSLLLACGVLIAACCPSADAAPPPATEEAPAYYVAVDGKPGNPDTQEAPWDILSALGGKQAVAPGATIYLQGGTYRKDRGPNPGDFHEKDDEKTVVGLAGAKGRAIHVRPVAGERVIIDGGLSVQNPSAHLWMWDLEILVSEPHPKKPVGPGSHPKDFHRPWGGLNVNGGRHLKFINFLIHDNRQGVSWWTGNQDSELYGAIIYDNGWPATDRGHGHCVYAQNKTGIKRVTDCILTCKYHGTYTMHAYGSRRADCDNFVMEGNIAYALGTFLVGSGKPSPWGQKTRTSHLLLYSQQLQAGIQGNLGRRQSPQISPSQDKFPTIGASAQLTHGGIS